MNVEAEPTLSETIEDTKSIDTWNMERSPEQLRSFVSSRLSAAALQDVSL